MSSLPRHVVVKHDKSRIVKATNVEDLIIVVVVIIISHPQSVYKKDLFVCFMFVVVAYWLSRTQMRLSICACQQKQVLASDLSNTAGENAISTHRATRAWLPTPMNFQNFRVMVRTGKIGVCCSADGRADGSH